MCSFPSSFSLFLMVTCEHIGKHTIICHNGSFFVRPNLTVVQDRFEMIWKGLKSFKTTQTIPKRICCNYTYCKIILCLLLHVEAVNKKYASYTCNTSRTPFLKPTNIKSVRVSKHLMVILQMLRPVQYFPSKYLCTYCVCAQILMFNSAVKESVRASM